MNNLPEFFTFSQSSLQDYTECARRFELRYLKRLRWPAVESQPALERERHMQRGADFHHLVHRHLLGLDADLLTESIRDATLRGWWHAYLDSAYAGGEGQAVRRYPETVITAPLGRARLVAKVDLLAVYDDGRLLIIDWKTTARKTPRTVLEKHLQTVVYRYLLATAGDAFNGGQKVKPEQVEMVYWFAADPQGPEHFPYSEAQYKDDAHTLAALIQEIDGRSTFDLTTETSRCRFCSYRSLCDRGIAAGDFNAAEVAVWAGADADAGLPDLDFDFDQIAEVEF